MSARALERFAARAQRAAGIDAEVDILITSSAHMRRLNRHFMGTDAATDVLSFPSPDGTVHHKDAETRKNWFSKSSVTPGFSGDIAISAEIASHNARRLGHSTADELKILILHGLLHLAGYDHEIDGGKMARKETRLQRALGLPTALIERAGESRRNGTERGTAKKRRS